MNTVSSTADTRWAAAMCYDPGGANREALMTDEKIVVENVNTPGPTERVNAGKYRATRNAMMAVLPDAAPGLAAAEIKEQLKPLLPDDLFPPARPPAVG